MSEKTSPFSGSNVVNHEALAATGGIVTTDFGGADWGASVALQPDGKILVAGGSDGKFALVRYNSDGSLDTSFSNDGKATTLIPNAISGYGQSVAVQFDGKILVAGGGTYDFGYALIGPRLVLARYDSDGSLDTSFSDDGIIAAENSGGGHSVTVQADGKILVAGYDGYHNYGYGSVDFLLMRYHSDGTLDSSFSGGGKVATDIGSRYGDAGHSVAVQADGKIVVAGSSPGSTDSFNDDFALVRYNSDGSLNTSFSGDGKLTTDIGAGNDEGQSVVVQADGKILVAGFSYNGGSGSSEFALVRYHADGSLDTSFSGDGMLTTDVGVGDDRGYSVTLQTDGKILVAGNSGDYFALVRYNHDGTLDTTFSGDGKVTTGVGTGGSAGYSVNVQPDGKIVVAGRSGGDFAVVRYNTDGSLDSTFSSTGAPPTVTITGNSSSNTLLSTVGDDVIDGGAGLDTVSYTKATAAVSVTLASNVAQNTGGAGIDTLLNIENLTGSSYNDTLTGNAAANKLTGGAGKDALTGNAGNDVLTGGAGNDILIGGEGNDTLIGGAGKDVLTGGAGKDVFKFNTRTESGLSSTQRDVITDFLRGQDKIDLSTIDADTAVAGNQAFTGLIGANVAFSQAGQLRLDAGVLYGNTDADATAEFAIALTGITTLANTDFVL